MAEKRRYSINLSKELAYFKIWRPVNLILVFFALLVFRFKAFDIYGLSLNMNNDVFLQFVYGVVLICGGGNVINDYFDKDLDLINKPNKTYVGKYISEKTAKWMAISAFIIGNVFLTVLAFYSNQYYIIAIGLLTTLLLVLYSFYLKKIFFVGTFVVSLLTAFIPVFYALVDLQIEQQKFYFSILVAYSLFAFTGTMAREIQKDLADYNGDLLYKHQTLPVRLGINKAKLSTSLILVIESFSAYYFFLSFQTFNKINLIQVLILLLCISVSILYTFLGKNRIHYLAAAKWNKISMFFALLLILYI